MRVGIHQGSILWPLIFDVVMDVVTEEVARDGHALMYADNLVLICETKEEARQRFVAWRNALESKELKVNISKTKVMRCARDGAPKKAAVDPCSVWKEGGCELNPLCNMWLLGTRAMFRSARKFGKSGTGLCVQSV